MIDRPLLESGSNIIQMGTLRAPRCVRNLKRELVELEENEHLEALRPYLVQFNLFPSHKDPNTAAIRHEELKKLIRFWKLHTERGFWKKYVKIHDMVALLRHHITNRLEYQSSSAPPVIKSCAKIASVPALPLTMPTYDGDLFAKRGQYTGGMIYHSRLCRDTSEREVRDGPSAENGDPPAIVASAEEQQTSNTTNNTIDRSSLLSLKRKCAAGLYLLSLQVQTTAELKTNGCLGAIAELTLNEDQIISQYCACAIRNLSCNPECGSYMVLCGTLPVISILSRCQIFNVKANCVYALANLSIQSQIEQEVLSEGALPTLSDLIRIEHEEIKRVCLVALLNFLKSIDQVPTVTLFIMQNDILPAIRYLATSDHILTRITVLECLQKVTLWAATRPQLRSALLNGRTVQLISQMALRDRENASHIELYAVACLSNLSIGSDRNQRLLLQGGLDVLSQFASRPVLEIRRYCATALTNIVIATVRDKLSFGSVAQVICTALVQLSTNDTGNVDILERTSRAFGLMLSIEYGDQMGTVVKSITDVLIKLFPLARQSALCQTMIHSLRCALVASLACQHEINVETVLDLIRKPCKHLPVVSNRAFYLECGRIVAEFTTVREYAITVIACGGLSFLIQLAAEEYKCEEIVITSFYNLSMFHESQSHLETSKITQLLLSWSSCVVKPRLIKSVLGTIYHLSDSASGIWLLTKHKALTYLLELPSERIPLVALSYSGTICNLTHVGSSITDLSLLPQVLAVISLLFELGDRKVTHHCAIALFNLTCNKTFLESMVDRHSLLNIPQKLVKMMRSGNGETQLYGARAMTNLICCDGPNTALSVQNLHDFRVIALLNANTEAVKEVCSKAFYNALAHGHIRQRHVEDDILWALMKLTEIDSNTTKFVCAKALLNLSCDRTSHGILGASSSKAIYTVISALCSQSHAEVHKMLCITLYNMSWFNGQREAMLKHGIVSILGQLSKLSDTNSKFFCTSIIYQLTLLPSLACSLVNSGVARILVQLSTAADMETIRICAYAFCNLSVNSSNGCRMIESDCIEKLIYFLKQITGIIASPICIDLAHISLQTIRYLLRDPKAISSLIQHNGISVLFAMVIKSVEQPQISEAAMEILVTISSESEVQEYMQASGSMNWLNQIIHMCQGLPKLFAYSSVMFYHFSLHGVHGSDSQLIEFIFQLATVLEQEENNFHIQTSRIALAAALERLSSRGVINERNISSISTFLELMHRLSLYRDLKASRGIAMALYYSSRFLECVSTTQFKDITDLILNFADGKSDEIQRICGLTLCKICGSTTSIRPNAAMLSVLSKLSQSQQESLPKDTVYDFSRFANLPLVIQLHELPIERQVIEPCWDPMKIDNAQGVSPENRGHPVHINETKVDPELGFYQTSHETVEKILLSPPIGKMIVPPNDLDANRSGQIRFKTLPATVVRKESSRTTPTRPVSPTPQDLVPVQRRRRPTLQRRESIQERKSQVFILPTILVQKNRMRSRLSTNSNRFTLKR